MSYNLLYPVHIVVAQSMATSITSNPVEVKSQDNVGIQMNWTGTPTGTFAFQVSMDYKQDAEGNVVNAGNWIAIPVVPSIAAYGSPDNAYVDLNQLSAMYVRVVYTAVSGSGSLDVYIDGKGV